MSHEETRDNLNSNIYEDIGEKASDAGLKLARRGKEVMSDLSSGAKKMGSKAVEKADGAMSTVGEGMTKLADSIRDKAPSEGTFGSAASAVADGLKTSGQYLSEHGVEDVAGEMTGLVRRYPIYSLWIGVGVGVLLGSMFSRK